MYREQYCNDRKLNYLTRVLKHKQKETSTNKKQPLETKEKQHKISLKREDANRNL